MIDIRAMSTLYELDFIATILLPRIYVKKFRDFANNIKPLCFIKIDISRN